MHNPNYYDLILSNFDHLYAETAVLVLTTFNMTVTYKFAGNGQLVGGSYVTIPALSSQTFGVAFYSNATAADVTAVSTYCFTNGITWHYSGSITTSTSLGFRYTFHFGKNQ